MDRSRLRHLYGPIGVAFVAAALTWALYRLKTIPGIGDVLAFGVIVSMIPFGGLHEAPFDDSTVMAIGAVFNGLLWGYLAYLLQRMVRALRGRKPSFDEHVI